MNDTAVGPDACAALSKVLGYVKEGQLAAAATTLMSELPFVPPTNVGRRYSRNECMRVFLRDGFIDRYSGQRLLNPGVLRVISSLFPIEFPFHRNWKQSECHMAIWQLFPTIDHVVPVARGGEDQESNWVTTCMFRNSAKNNALLTEIGWRLHAPGDLSEWDGQTSWFIDHIGSNFERLQIREHRKYIQMWLTASQSVLAGDRL